MSEIQTQLFKIPPEMKYFADDKTRISDGETFVITEDHSHADILRFVVTDIGKEEAIFILKGIDDE